MAPYDRLDLHIVHNPLNNLACLANWCEYQSCFKILSATEYLTSVEQQNYNYSVRNWPSAQDSVSVIVNVLFIWETICLFVNSEVIL